MNYDVVIIGAGPAGLATAIQLKQLTKLHDADLSVAVLEKGSSVGAHIISGCVMDPVGLTELIPNWQELDFPVKAKVTQEKLAFMTPTSSIKLPHPQAWSNKGNYIISLSQLCTKLAEYAEELGVEIYPGFPVVETIIENNQVVGIITGDSGLDKYGNPTHNYQPGIEIRSQQVVVAEGCRGSVSKQIIQHYALDTHASPQTFGLGIKEIWQVTSAQHKPGYVLHSVGYPLNNHAYGGGFVYHLDNNLVAVGLVTALDYSNPYLNPYEEFQKFKLHPEISSTLNSAKRLEYGARTVVEGGIQALPKLSFPGGVLVGDSAGFINVPKIKGVHNAIKSGILAANSIMLAIKHRCIEATEYEAQVKASWLYNDLYKVRNIRPAFKAGLYLGLLYAGIDHYFFRGNAPWTLKWKTPDHKKLKPKAEFKPISYSKPDGVITFDRASSVYLANINHTENQPCHLRLKHKQIPIQINLASYASPESRYCPAGVYEIMTTSAGDNQLQIHAQNCVHCKACDIKDPLQNITWVPPEAGSGPQYSEM
jgi:electron-transferring-flavoprotein dehydrogenase